MRIRMFQALVAAIALALATLSVGTGTAAAQDYGSYGSHTPPAAAPAAPAPDVSSTGHLVTAGNGFASIVNGNTAGPVSGQATAITPKQGSVAATAAPSALAHTGSEAYLAYAGLGLIAAGAVAMGSRRRSTES